MSKIADTTFNTGPTDDVAAVDVYQTTDTAPKNKNVTSPLSKFASSAASALKSSNVSAVDLVKATSIEDGKASVSKSSATDLVKSATGGLDSPIADLKSDLTDELLKAVGFKDDKDLEAAANGAGIPGAGNVKKGLTVNDVKFLYNTVQTIRKADISSATGVASLLNSIAGNSQLASVLHLDSQFAVLGKVMNKINELKIPEAIDMLLDKMADDKERRRLLLENLRNAIMQSDVYTINKALDYVGASGVISRVPDAISLFLMFYRLPPGVPAANTATLNQVVALLTRIDPHWFEYQRGNAWVSNLEPFTYASPDATDLFMLSATHKVRAMIAKTYYSESMIEMSKGYYEYCPL